MNPFDTDYALAPEPDDAEDAAADEHYLDWLSVSSSDPVVVTKASTGYKRTYTVTVGEQTVEGTRRALLLIRNKANVTARDTLHISQTKDAAPAP